MLVARAPQRLLDGSPVRDVARDPSDVHLEHWTYVLTKYNSRFGLRFLDLPATLALLDAKARGEVAVGV